MNLYEVKLESGGLLFKVEVMAEDEGAAITAAMRAAAGPMNALGARQILAIKRPMPGLKAAPDA